MTQDPLRRAFERWFEAAAMPSESNWFRRDPQDPEEYDLSIVSHAWDGFQAGYEECQRQRQQDNASKPSKLKERQKV